MFRLNFVMVLVVFLLTACTTSKNQTKREITVAFYNVENLFDLVNEPGKSDGEFTPSGNKKWTSERYNKKIADLSLVLKSINPDDLPEIIGLCEVENKQVLEDLVQHKNLAAGKYKVVHYESPDIRGIDCALIYRPDEFKIKEHFPVPVLLPDNPDFKTRDILYVKGKTRNNEYFHVFVNHWPSRVGGIEQTEPKRMEVAKILKSKIDSILYKSAKANIVVLGDMNDEPNDKSLVSVLGASAPDNTGSVLKNLMFDPDMQGKGTYYYRGEWNMLDNIVVSESLLDDNGFSCSDKTGHIFRQEWMEYKNNNGLSIPNRTYGGAKYFGGISDHLPVYVKFER